MPTEKELLATCSQVGNLLLNSGAETFRIENTIEHIGKAAQTPIVCYSTLTAIFITINESTDTLFIKPKMGGYDLKKVDAINQLSRDFTQQKINFNQFNQAVIDLDQTVTQTPFWLQVLGAGLVSMAPMLVFKATWTDLSLSFFVGLLAFIFSKKITNHYDFPYISEVVGGFTIGLLASLLVKFHIGDNLYNIIISSLMPLVPGVAITNAIREIIAKEIISGIVRITYAFFVAGAIAFGVILAIEVCH